MHLGLKKIISVALVGLCLCFPLVIHAQNKIVYYLFDSLETYFQNEIKNHPEAKEIGFVINPYCSHRHEENNPVYYEIGIVVNFSHEPGSEIFSKSNRQMPIGDHYYPIYIMHIDDIFTEEGTSKNSVVDDFLYPDVGWHHRIDVDMARKTFIVDGKVRGKHKK